MAVAVIDRGKVGYVQAYGIRNDKGDPLTIDTVMYGASVTKAVFAYTVMQLVDQGKLKLDTPLKDDLDNPLPTYGPDPVFPDKYGPYKDLIPVRELALCCAPHNANNAGSVFMQSAAAQQGMNFFRASMMGRSLESDSFA